MDTLINSVGGYGSVLFWLLLVGCLIVGLILVKLVSPYFVALQIFGAVILISYVNHIVQTTPNMPSQAQYIPLLCAATMIVGVFLGMRRRGVRKSAEQKAGADSGTSKRESQ